MIFKDPWVFIFVPIILIFLFLVKRKEQAGAFRFPSMDLVADIRDTWKTRCIQLPFFLRAVVIFLMLIALAGPRSVLQETTHKTQGFDIVLAIDASGSMLAEDFTIDGKRQNRLEVVKHVVNEFVDGRPDDRMGLVAFGGLAYTVSPLTSDHAWLKANLDRVSVGLIEDGTAIGSGISSALSRLRHSQAKSKIIVLLTDGVNNAGSIDPVSAALAAKALNIKIYTIGVGTRGYAPFPVQDVFGRTVYQKVKIDVDEDGLRKSADLTGGKYFRATDTNSLREIYREIDRLEKTKIETLNYREYKELFTRFLLAAISIWFLELILSQTIFLRIP